MGSKTNPRNEEQRWTPASIDSKVWRLHKAHAELETSQLTARIDLADPAKGLGKLAWGGDALSGSALGVATNDPPLSGDASDAYARGDDLVATYAETAERPFSLQVYWRAIERGDAVVMLDAILSLQTPLLESFPGVSTQSRLTGAEVWLVPSNGAEPTVFSEVASQRKHESADCIVLRPAEADWSYAEMTHPDDRGQWQIQMPAEGQCVVRRELGGTFLEKGVIRRLRVRGVFLPRARDLELAKECMANLAHSAPPLTV